MWPIQSSMNSEYFNQVADAVKIGFDKDPILVPRLGGSLPLYLFETDGPTVNIGIDLLTRVKMETREDKEIYLHSVDLDVREEATDVDSLDLESELGFISRIIKFYRPKVTAL